MMGVKKKKKGNLKGTLPCVEKRLPGRLTQLPFIASDKRLNHTLHSLKCLLVIRSRILVSLLSLCRLQLIKA